MFGIILFRTMFSFCVSIISTLTFKKLAEKLKFFDKPDGILKFQVSPIPYLGGVAIFTTVVVVLSMFSFFEPTMLVEFIKFLFFVTPFFIIGLIDDMFNLSAGIKFLLQIFASLFCLYLLGGLFFTLVKIVLLLFLLMAVVNSFNLIDVSDGLLSSVCVPFALLFIFYAFFFKLIFAGYLAQIFLGAILGFMYFNWQPAKIYLGDAGSLFLAATSFFLLTNIFLQSSGLFLFSFIAILIFGVPLAEVFSLVIIRKKLGLPIYLGSPHHFSIYLKRQGLSSQHVAYLSAAASLLLSSLASLVFFKIIPMLVGFFIAATSFVFWLYFIYSPTMPIFRFISFLKRK